MKEFGIWYFETGYIINYIIAIITGFYSGIKNRWKVLLAYCILSLLVGITSIYLKNYY